MPQDAQAYNTPSFPEYLPGGIDDQLGLWQGVPQTRPYLSKTPLLTSGISTKIVGEHDDRKYFREGLSAACEDAIGIPVVAVDYPGGRGRAACRLHLQNGQSVIASRRAAPGRAKLEERVIAHLSRHNAPIARSISFNGLVLLQEDLGDVRLSMALANASETEYEFLMTEALVSLRKIQLIAEHENLRQFVPILGAGHEWVVGLIDRVAILGNLLQVQVPTPDLQNIYDVLTLYRPQFVKWDARPGKAMLGKNRKISWFDWENCGARNRVDDLVWLMCDDMTPHYPDAENRLIEKFLPRFSEGRDLEFNRRYIRVFGVLHSAVRLARIMHKKNNKEWWDYNEVVKKDKAGVTLRHSQQICKRAAYWSKQEPMVAMLSDWFLAVSEKLEML